MPSSTPWTSRSTRRYSRRMAAAHAEVERLGAYAETYRAEYDAYVIALATERDRLRAALETIADEGHTAGCSRALADDDRQPCDCVCGTARRALATRDGGTNDG
jgi:hypothetical protein